MRIWNAPIIINNIIIVSIYAFLNTLIFYILDQRSSDGISGISAFTHDTNMYINAIEGKFTPQPFSTRFLALLLAKAFPNAATGLLWINIICMFILLLSLHHLSKFFSRSELTSFVVVCSIASAFSFLYNFHNPFLTDIPAIAALTLFILCCYQRKFFFATVFICISIAFRETGIIFIPLGLIAFFLPQGIFLISAALFLYIAPKLYIAGDIYRPTLNLEILNIYYIAKIGISFGVLFLISVYTLVKKNLTLDKVTISIITISLLGASYSSLTAFDTTRMMFVMAPAITVLLTFFISDNIHKFAGEIFFIIIINVCIGLLIFPSIFNKMDDINSLDESALKNARLIATLFIFQIILFIRIARSSSKI